MCLFVSFYFNDFHSPQVFVNFMLIKHVQFASRPICGVHFPFNCSIFIACSQDGKVKVCAMVFQKP